MAISEAQLFRKQAVPRPPATSILSSLFSSPKPTCLSPDLASPPDCFSKCDLTSWTDSPSPSIRTPPRRSCLSFAAAPAKSPPTVINSTIPKTEIDSSVRTHFPNPVNKDNAIAPKENTSSRPVIGSVFDEFGEDKSSPIFHDYYLVGQPKKLVDDCLRKEKDLRILPPQEEQDKYYGDESPGSMSDKDEEDEEDEDGDYDAEYDSEEESPTKNVNSTRSLSRAADLTTPVRLRLDMPVANGPLLSPAVYTPSRDVVDNFFVPGTLDEDQIEVCRSRLPKLPHDIDPTYPSDAEEDGDKQTRQARLINSPVRFISSNKGSIFRRLPNTPSPPHATWLNRTHSLPWGRRRHNRSLLKPPVTKRTCADQPRCSAIAITKYIEYRRHHRKEKKEEVVRDDERKGIGAAAMAAMARQLTSKHKLGGVWALSV